MTTDIQTTEARDMGRVAESLVTRGDLSDLTPAERARHYINTCDGLGLNPASQPFSFLTLQGKLVMYANRGASDQLAAMHRVTRRITRGPEEITLGGQKLVICVAEASMPNGRVETSIATVPMTDPVNVLMKAETKAKRRVTLSILGLGMLDETELETIPASAKGSAVQVDVTVQRDDAPAQLAAPDALAAFRDALTYTHDLAGVVAVYQAADLGGTSAKPITDAVRARLADLEYHLTAVEASALLGGTLDATLATAYDRLAAITRHADDEDGDGVIADVVRVIRDCRSLAGSYKVRLFAVSIATVTGLRVADAKARLTAALTPPTPPTGTDAPRASTDADVAGGSVAPAESTGAMARDTRTVLDTDTAHLDLAGTWRATEAGWRAHLAEMTVRRRVEASVSCNGAALGPAFLALAAERIVALDAERPHVAGVARLTVIGVTQTLERVAYDASRARAAQGKRAA